MTAVNSSALAAFQGSMTRVRKLGAIFRALTGTNGTHSEFSDLLRAQLVMAVSALDQLVHELARNGAIDAFEGRRAQTDAFLRLPISTDAALRLLSGKGDSGPYRAYIRQHLGVMAFQQPDRIADALRIVTDLPIWNAVAKITKTPAKHVKARLSLIVHRRNQIVHEADIDPTDASLSVLWPIDVEDVASAIQFIESIGVALCTAVETSNPAATV